MKKDPMVVLEELVIKHGVPAVISALQSAITME
jgi:hypothetical protein